MPRKKDIIEDLNNAVIDKTMINYEKTYLTHLNEMTDRATELIENNLRPTQNRLFKSFRLNNVILSTRTQYVVGGIQLVLQGAKNKNLKPLSNILAIYSVTNPKLFVDRMDKLIKVSMGQRIKLTRSELKALREIDIYMRQNNKAIKDLVQKNTTAMRIINKKITTNQSRAIIKRRNKLIKQRITVNGVKRPLTNEEIAKRLRSEFKNDRARVNRIVDTEAHRQTELVREVEAKAVGLTKKIWNTQRDSKVRDSHAKLDGKKIGINKKFNVGGHKASFPGDPRLPPNESINCRCFLTFE